MFPWVTRGVTVEAELDADATLGGGTPLRVYGRYTVSGPVEVRVTGKRDRKPFEQVATLNFPEKETSHPEIERMWAWRRVQRLLKDADRAGSREQAVDEVVRLGEAFSIATEYTSFLVLENDAEYQRWKIERRNTLLLARDPYTGIDVHGERLTAADEPGLGVRPAL